MRYATFQTQTIAQMFFDKCGPAGRFFVKNDNGRGWTVYFA